MVALCAGLANAGEVLRLLVTPQTRATDIAHAEHLAQAMGRQAHRVRVVAPTDSGGGTSRDDTPRDIRRALSKDTSQPYDSGHARLDSVADVASDTVADALLEALIRGEGDLIAEPLILDEVRSARLSFSEARQWTRSVLIARDGTMATGTQRRVLVHPTGPHWVRLLAIRDDHPELELVPASARMTSVDMQRTVASGEVEMAAIWSHELSPKWSLETVLPLSDRFPIAQAIRRQDASLASALDAASISLAVLGDTQSVHRTDLGGIRERGRLRVATVAEPGSYLPVDGRLRGFEYDLIHAFARAEGLALEVVVADDRAGLIPLLTEGRADVAASFLTPTARLRAQGVTFTRPYHQATGRVMMLDGRRCPVHGTDLTGYRLMLPERSPYLGRLQSMAAELDFSLRFAPALSGVPELIDAAERSGADGIVVDEHLAAANRAWRDDVMSCVGIDDSQRHAWAVRIRDQALLEALNRFIERSRRNGFINLRHADYFDDHERMQSFARAFRRYHDLGHLTEFDTVVRRYAASSGFDWRLILAQISEESGFNPAAVSSAGALGLMQLKPATARELGIDNPHDPEQGIRAGITYMRWLWNRFEAELAPDDRLWFTLAAYNAGLSQVRIARQVATARGLDPNRWFGHVERTIRDARGPDLDAGLARLRGAYAIRYVRDVQVRYQAYAGLLDANTPRRPAPSVLAAGG